MSASSKKKLRKEQEAAKLTEKQLAAQKEAKKLNLLTIAFVAVMAVILVVAITVGVNQTITANGIREKNTTALTVGDHELSSVEMNYYFVDSVQTFLNNYGAYASMFGLDLTLPLNEQVVNEETGDTWADDFLSSAKSTAQSVYALCDAAAEAGFTLSQEELTEVEYNVQNLETYATLYGFADADAFLKANYGNGASTESYLEYSKMRSLADAYQISYAESLTYEDADLRAVDAEDFNRFSSFSYNTYFLSTSKFDSAEAAEAAAKSLVSAEINTVEALDAAIAALEINKDNASATSTDYEDTLYTSVSSIYADWLTDSSRKAGDTSYFPSTSTDADGNETVSGYYVVMFNGSTDNTFALANVRHILVNFEGGTTDETTGATTYSEEEKAAAKAAAEDLLKQWEAGDNTEDSFAALATEHTDDTGSATTGGLYENVYPDQMVVNFNDWCFDEARKTGDTGIVESNYGYHVMFYAGDSDMNYRDYMIENELRETDVSEWFTALTEAASVTEGDTQYLRMDMVLQAA